MSQYEEIVMQRLDPSQKSVKISFKVPESVRDDFVVKAKEDKTTMSILFRKWLDEYLVVIEEEVFIGLELEYKLNPPAAYHKLKAAGYTEKDILELGKRIRQ